MLTIAPIASQPNDMKDSALTERISVPDVPRDLFLLILRNLEAWDVVRCQKVSRAWRDTFTKLEYLQVVLKKYPRARELRSLDPTVFQLKSSSSLQVDWSELLRLVASRYYHLAHGKAKAIIKYNLTASEQVGHWFPVGQWDYHESQPGGRLYYENVASQFSRMTATGVKPSLFRSTLWSYDDGLLVYAPAVRLDPEKVNQILAVLDIKTGRTYPVPFDVSCKIIRSMRLRHRALIIEWAEKDPFHDLNDMEQVNRHFATCFDVRPIYVSSWKVTRRSEWKMHFLGLPLNNRDRFFSTHTATHYAVYFWQPNRSMYTGDEERPIESLFVWDISIPSAYLPSSDPSGKNRPSNKSGPHVVARFPFNELDYFGIRQHSNIALMSLHLDSENSLLTVRENMCVAGSGYFDPAERLWCAKTTSFPFIGQGAHLRREWDGNLPPYRGHCSMESTDVEEPDRYFLPVMDVVDEAAGVKLSLIETCFTGHSVQNRLDVRVKLPGGEWVSLQDDRLVRELSGMGRIAGDERWVVGQNERMEVVIVHF